MSGPETMAMLQPGVLYPAGSTAAVLSQLKKLSAHMHF